MAALGIKVNNSYFWYAIAEKNDEIIQIKNLNSEFRVQFPVRFTELSEKASWLFDEISKILDHNNNIGIVTIKENEFSSHREDASKRISSNLDGVILAAASHKNVKAVKIQNRSMGVNTNNILDKAEAISGKTNKNWSKEIAEAILAANSGFNE